MRNRAVVMTASVGFVLCSAALSGCGGGTGAAEGPPASGAGQSQPVSGGAQSDPVPVPGEVVNGVAKDEATWSTPLAVYFGVDTNDLRLHAQSVVTATYMHENGYADFRENYDSTAPRPRTTAPDGVGRLFNEELAAQYGYRNAPNPQYLVEADVEAAGGGGLYENASPEFKDQWYACLDRATAEVNEGEPPRRLPTGDGPDQATLDSIQSQLNRFHIDTTGPQLQADAAAWRQCMAPLGIADLPDRPWEAGSMRMPDSLRGKWDWRPSGKPSADEVEVAAHDAQCRRSSGWSHDLYDQTWDQSVLFYNQHRAELDPMLAEYAARSAHYRQIITQHGGTPRE